MITKNQLPKPPTKTTKATTVNTKLETEVTAEVEEEAVGIVKTVEETTGLKETSNQDIVRDSTGILL